MPQIKGGADGYGCVLCKNRTGPGLPFCSEHIPEDHSTKEKGGDYKNPTCVIHRESPFLRDGSFFTSNVRKIFFWRKSE
ncbi:MAG: hypothetical protein J7L16_10880 [Deltaproteobacteria bacterium]|nr:hypothetical protein [Deltaproteobacteria bacterium]